MKERLFCIFIVIVYLGIMIGIYFKGLNDAKVKFMLDQPTLEDLFKEDIVKTGDTIYLHEGFIIVRKDK